ncbi:MAG: DUF1828 domain-containing protein [Rhodobacteraceae bacterium]|nr:DUF1828 domain-containing protein [Paracoccaceae bacterium]
MIYNIEELLDNYCAWLKDRTKFRAFENYVEITTPYLDRHNDYLQIYARHDINGGFVLSDDGYILDDLELSGCKINSPKRQSMFHTILNGYGVKVNKSALIVKATPENFSLKKHSLVQAMLAVNDLYFLATPNVTGLFSMDVADWLDNSEIRYTPNVKFTGESGQIRSFDFVIPKSKMQPERILKVINRPKPNSAQTMVFSWIDIKKACSPEARAFAILNDSQKTVSDNVLETLQIYNVSPIQWSKRDEMVDDLAA